MLQSHSGRRLAVTALVFALGCADKPPSSPGPTEPSRPPSAAEESSSLQRFSGVHSMGFEFSRFNASGQCEHTAEDGHVWLVGNAEYMARLRELVPTGLHSPTVYVKLSFRGRLSPPGRYGHLDMWKRQVTIVELEHAELASHCPAPTGVTSRWGLDDRIRYVAGGLEPIADDRVIADGLPELLKHVQFERMTIVSHPGPGETAELAEKRAQALLESFRNGGVTLPIAVRVGARSQPFIEFEAFGPDDD